jgi:hypothetical protein
MRSKCVLAFVAAFILAGAVFAQTSGSQEPIFKRSGDLIWTELNPAFPGIRIVDVWGDHTTSGYGAFLEFPAGFLSPLHTHTDDIKIVVISGTKENRPCGWDQARMRSSQVEITGTSRAATRRRSACSSSRARVRST